MNAWRNCTRVAYVAYFACFAYFAEAKPIKVPSPQIGVIVLAHGGNKTWDANVRKAVEEAKLTQPTKVVFGMAMHDMESYQEAVDDLVRQGVSRLVVVPLLISSHSEVYWQYQYIFRLRNHPGVPEWKVPQLKVDVPVVMTPALDHDPLVADILWDRAKKSSLKPKQEVLVLVAHGPNDETANASWLNSMKILGDHLKAKGGFVDVKAATLREDAEPKVQAHATAELRRMVAEANHQYGVVVVPLLMSSGGIEHGIPKRLKGLEMRFKPQGLLPHPRIGEWIRERVLQYGSS